MSIAATPRSAMVDWWTGKTRPADVSARYVTTFNGDPSSGGTENISTITGSSNRVAITSSMAAASSGAAASNADITITASAAAGATVDHLGFYDAQTGGNLIGQCPVTSLTLVTNDSLRIVTGGLSVSIT